MKKDKTYYLGKIVKRYGLKGELLAKIDTDEPENYENLESVFLEINGKLIPFFLNKSTLHKTMTLRLHFEDVNSIEEADKLIGKSIFLPLDDLPELTGNKFYYHEVIDFEAVDKERGKIGIIKEINDLSPQAYFIIVDEKNNEILIPVSDNFIVKVDRDNKAIIFKTPEGLIDLYKD